MGIAVFFSHYASFTNEKKYSKFVDVLIEGLCYQLLLSYSMDNDYDIFSFDYETGVSGIGIGIDYLVKQGFMEADLDIVLEDIDVILAKRLTGKELPVSLMLDIGKYFLVRLSDPQTGKKQFFAQIMEQILQFVNNYLQINPLQHPQIFKFLNELSGHYTNPLLTSLLNRQYELVVSATIIKEEGNIFFYESMIEELMNKPDKNIFCYNMEMGGLLNSYAGLGLSLLSILDSRHNSWLNLL